MDFAADDTVFTVDYTDITGALIGSTGRFSVSDNFTVKYDFTITPELSGQHTLTLTCAGTCSMTFNTESDLSFAAVNTTHSEGNLSVSLLEDSTYPIHIAYEKMTGPTFLQLMWTKPGEITPVQIPNDQMSLEYALVADSIYFNVT